MLFLSHWCDSNWCPFWAETIYSLAPMYVCSTFNEIKKCMFVQQIKNQQLLSWVLFYSVANAQQVKPDLLNLMTLGQNKWKISQRDIFSTFLAFTQSFTVLQWFHIWLVLACIEGYLQDGGIHSKSEDSGIYYPAKKLNFPQISSKMQQNGPKIPKMAQSDPNMTPNGSKWP